MFDLTSYLIGKSQGNGSGGDSRFTFAQVTITANAGLGSVVLTGVGPHAEGYAFMKEYIGYGTLISTAEVPAGETAIATALLIDGSAEFEVTGNNAVVTGNADYEDNLIYITGDCTITADPTQIK